MVEITIPTSKPNDSRAVSPVIGVILMVAITVILAAIIGAFVLNMGQNIGDTPPRAVIGAEDAGDQYADADDGTDIVYLNHNNGESVKFSNLKIVVTSESGEKVATFSASNGWTDGKMVVHIDGAKPDSANQFSTGDQLVLKHDTDTGTVPPLDDGTTYRFQFIHTKSGSTISVTSVTIN